MYSYVHFVAEVLSFFLLQSLVGDSWLLWLAPFIYDTLAFIPQFFIGAISDRNAKIPFGIIGIAMLIAGLCMHWFGIGPNALIAVIILALGNACVHVNGAEVTLRSGKGKIAPAAIFVAGGAFGVITGKLLAGVAPLWSLIALALTAIPFILLAEKHRTRTKNLNNPCEDFKFDNPNMPTWLLTIAVTLVVMIRSYIGYGIPTSWNKTVFQTILLFSFMGIGKALGGILTDKIGIRKTIYLSMIGALPFLLFGDQNMYLSLIGVMFFSMTMAITLSILVSRYQKRPGVAFGFTTIGLAIGALPIFFFRIKDLTTNCTIITLASIICLLILLKATQKEVKHVKSNR